MLVSLGEYADYHGKSADTIRYGAWLKMVT